MKVYGVNQVSHDSKYLGPEGAGCILQIYVNLKTGHVWANLEASSSTRTVYYDDDIHYCGDIEWPHTVGMIIEMIETTIEELIDCEEIEEFVEIEYGWT